jgi:signal transduction histidine kinase
LFSLLFPLSFLRAGFFAGIFFLLVAGSSCTAPAPSSQSGAPPAAVARFKAQLDSIQTLPTDTVRSQGLRALYARATPDVRKAVFQPVLQVAADLLFYHTAADTQIISFYQGLSADPQLAPLQRAQAAQNLAAFYAHFAGDADSARFYITRAQAQATRLSDTLRNKITATQAQIYQLEGNLPAATKSLYETLAGSEKAGDADLTARIHGNLANVYRAMEDYSQAVAHRKKAGTYFISKGEDAAAFIALSGLAADYTSLQQSDSARSYIAQSEALLKKGVQNPVAEYFLDLSAGGLYVTLKDYDSAILWFNKAKVILPQLQDPVQEFYFTLCSSPAYASRQPVTEEVQLIEEYISLLLADSNLGVARDAFHSLYLIAVQQPVANGDALHYYQLYDSLRMVLSNNKNRAYMAEMEAKYGAEKQRLTIQLQERKLQQRGTLIGMLAFAVLSIVLAGTVLFIRFRLNRSRRKASMQQRFTAEMLKNTEAERGRIAMDLHDGIGHELLTLKHSLHQQTAESESKIDTILNNLRMLSRNLHPVMLDKIGLEHSIYSLCEQITAGGQLFVSADIDYGKELKPECELQLYRIVQESLSNAVKYADAHAAKVSIQRNGQTLSVTVIDNGKGFDVAEKLASNDAFGLHSILERSKVLGGKALFHSGRQGTTLSIEIPLS